MIETTRFVVAQVFATVLVTLYVIYDRSIGSFQEFFTAAGQLFAFPKEIMALGLTLSLYPLWDVIKRGVHQKKWPQVSGFLTAGTLYFSLTLAVIFAVCLGLTWDLSQSSKASAFMRNISSALVWAMAPSALLSLTYIMLVDIRAA